VFKPSHDSLLKQNAEIDRLDLPRIQDDAELEQLKLDGKLVPIVPSEALRVDPRLDPDRRYCRPWTLKFVQDLADAYHQQFGDQIQVNSAVRTVVVQKKLRRHNRNAAPAEGEIASSHLAGLTVDLQRRGMSKAEVKWVENYLIPMKAAGLVEPEEERRQWVFHPFDFRLAHAASLQVDGEPRQMRRCNFAFRRCGVPVMSAKLFLHDTVRTAEFT